MTISQRIRGNCLNIFDSPANVKQTITITKIAIRDTYNVDDIQFDNTGGYIALKNAIIKNNTS